MTEGAGEPVAAAAPRSDEGGAGGGQGGDDDAPVPASPDARRVLADVRLELGLSRELPAPYGPGEGGGGAASASSSSLARSPELLGAVWALEKAAVYGGPAVPRTTKLLCAAAIAAACGRRAGLGRRLAELGALGLEADLLRDLAERAESPRLPDRKRRVIAFAVHVARTPAEPVDAALLQGLKRDGVTEDELREVAVLAAACAAVDLLADALSGRGS